MPIRLTLTLLACSAALFPRIAYCAEPDASTIVKRSVEMNQKDWEAQPDYSFKETDRDAHGSKTYQVSMIDGSPYRELIAENGHPLSPDDQTKQQQLLQKTISDRAAESPSDREKREAKYKADRERDHVLMEQLSQAFDFKLIGIRRLHSYRVYELRATPRNGYQPPNVQSQVLRGMRGELWIDTATFQWVKVTAKVISPVSIEGFLAQVEPGTYFELEKKPVAAGIWLPSHFQMKSHSRILFLIGHHEQADDTYFDYKEQTK